METSIFPVPAVAGVLNENYVESRLHMDVEPARSKYRTLQAKLAGGVARPTYVLVDPNTETVLAKQKGWLPNVTGFTSFLRGPLE